MAPARLALMACITAALAVGWPPPAQAVLGALGKLGAAAGKAGGGAAGKGAAAAGGAAVVGNEAVTGAGAAAKAGKAGGATDTAGGAASAEQITRSTGLGPAVPDEVAAMLRTPGKTLADVPDPGTRSWLSTPAAQLKAADADLMVRDYVALVEGRPAAGPRTRAQPAGDSRPIVLPADKPGAAVPWYALELLARAAHAGNRVAQAELDRRCASGTLPPGPPCPTPARVQAGKK